MWARETGGGGAAIGRMLDAGSRATSFLAVEPELNLEMKIISAMRIGVGGGYRFVADPFDWNSPISNRLSGVTMTAMLKLGRF